MIVELSKSEVEEVEGASIIRDAGRAAGRFVLELSCTGGPYPVIWC